MVHMSRLGVTLVIVCVLHVPPGTMAAQVAQEGSQVVTAVQYFKCHDTEAFDRFNETVWMPQVRRAMERGQLIGWGQLNHFWGDEWNRVLYNTAPDIQTFHATFSEMMRTVLAEHPDEMAILGAACTEHKDNIYLVARTVLPPVAAVPEPNYDQLVGGKRIP
jgi:hypothetical protein